VGEDNICTSIIVAAELRYGCAKSSSKRLLKAVDDLLGEIHVLPFEVPADAEYGGIPLGTGNSRKANRRQRPADRRPRLCHRRHDRDHQYRRIQTYPRPNVENWLI